MATLYQLHSTMDKLRRSTEHIALTWRAGDSILLLGTTVAFIDWLQAYLDDSDIEDITAIYALTDDVNELAQDTQKNLKLDNKVTGILSDNEWVAMTQNDKFDKVVTVNL